MNKTESAKYIEEVRGNIIGDQWVTGQLFKEGRQQGPQFIGDNDSDVREKAIAYVGELKTRLGAEYARIYPDGLELRIWD
jgi:hypothetical protein